MSMYLVVHFGIGLRIMESLSSQLLVIFPAQVLVQVLRIHIIMLPLIKKREM